MQVAIVVYPGMTALDAVGPYEVLRFVPGAEIRFVSRKPGPVVTDSKVLVLEATHSYEETPSPDIVIVPGSEADTTTAMADGALIGWLKRVHDTSRWTVSVCSGALVLASAGLLEGRPATTHWIAQRPLEQMGAEARPNQRIVRSGKIVTAAGVSAGIDVALWLVKETFGRRRAEIIQLILEYDPQPPVDAGHPDKAVPEVRRAARSEMRRRMKNPRNVLSIPRILWRKGIGAVRRTVLRR